MAEAMNIYPNKEKSFQNELRRLQDGSLSSENKQLITEYMNTLISQNLKKNRITKVIRQIRFICEWLEEIGVARTLANLTKSDVRNLIAHINQIESYSDNTKADYRKRIKQFYKWFESEDERIESEDYKIRLEAVRFYKYIKEEVRTNYKTPQADANTIISDGDIEEVISTGANTIKEKAFLSTLHETGARAAEFLNLHIGNIVFKETHAEVHIPDGKTGKRIVYVIRSVPYLQHYLSCHSHRGDSSAYLWLSESNSNRGEPLLHRGGQKLIDRCFERANIKKKHNWHWFRHSRATILAPKYTEIMLCRYMGWVPGSDCVKAYVHLSNKHLEDVFLASHGIKSDEDAQPKTCKCTCGQFNYVSNRYCSRCQRPLSVDVISQDKEMIDSEVGKTMQFFMEMAKNPSLMQKFEAFQKGIDGDK